MDIEKLAREADRAAFEKWLADVHLLTATWNEARNCYDEFPAHLAYKAWKASAALTAGDSDKVEREFGECAAAIRERFKA